MITIKSKQEIGYMREAGKIVAEALLMASEATKAGVTTAQIDTMVEAYIRKCGAIPSFKGYRGFPASICASVNDEVVHGIPNDRILENGDILSVDVGAIMKGYHADAARTFAVGEISDAAKRLIRVTEESFFKGIEKAVHGNRLNEISTTIQMYVELHGYSVVRELSGHGIGKNLHEDPDIPNFSTGRRGVSLLAGMTLAIEPMVNEGKQQVLTLPNQWTVVTCDHSLSAHYENTIVITSGAPLILTV